MLDYYLLKIRNNSWIRGPAFSFCTAPYKLCTRFCLSAWYTQCAILAAVGWLSFQLSFSCPTLNSQVMAVFVKCGSSCLIGSRLQQASVPGRIIPCHLGIRGIVLESSMQVLWFWFQSQRKKSLEKGTRRRARTCEWLSDPSLQLETRERSKKLSLEALKAPQEIPGVPCFWALFSCFSSRTQASSDNASPTECVQETPTDLVEMRVLMKQSGSGLEILHSKGPQR